MFFCRDIGSLNSFKRLRNYESVLHYKKKTIDKFLYGQNCLRYIGTKTAQLLRRFINRDKRYPNQILKCFWENGTRGITAI